MSGEVWGFDLVAYLNKFKLAVHHLIGENAAEAVEETGLVDVLDMHGRVTILNMALEALVDPDLSTLSGFLLVDCKAVTSQELLPCQTR